MIHHVIAFFCAEPERTLLLSEKASADLESGEVITAHENFHFLSTMNPGGDYGKKEVNRIYLGCCFGFIL